MRFTKGVKKEDSDITLTHNYQQLRWNVRVLERGKRGPKKAGTPLADEEELIQTDPFEHLNQYLATLPLQKQNELFSVYDEIYNVMEPHGADGVAELRKALPPLVKKIYEICTAESISAWVHATPTIIFPANIRVFDTLAESAENGDQFGISTRPQAATYVKKDYWGLVVFTMMSRLMVPVWGRFLANTESTIGNDIKEIYAMRLATRTALVETDGYKRLEDYVAQYLSQDKYKNSVIGGGVSREDVPFRIIAILTVRRLAWVDFSGRDPQFSLVGRVYSFIENEMDSADRIYNESIKPKVPENGSMNNDHENRSSVSELIKIKEPYTAGDLTIIESAAGIPQLFLNRIAPDMPPEFLEGALRTVEYLKQKPPAPVQFTIMQNAMGAECKMWDGQWEEKEELRERWDCIFPPRAGDEMNLLEGLNMMAVAAALLWYRGHYDVVALMTASVAKEQAGFSNGTSAPPALLTKENEELLRTHFPYIPRPAGKKRLDDFRNAKQSDIKMNVAYKCIEMIREELIHNSWNLNIPKEWIAKLPNHPGGRRYSVRSDIRNRLAEFAISIATRSL